MESFSFTALLQPGTVTDRIEKLDSEHHEKLHELVEKKLRLSMLQTKRTCAKDLLDFLEWCQAHPGKVHFLLHLNFVIYFLKSTKKRCTITIQGSTKNFSC